MHLLGVQNENFDLTLDKYANHLDSKCHSFQDLKKIYNNELLIALYEDFVIDEINGDDKYKIGDLIWIYPTYYTSRMYYGYNNIVLEKITNKKILEINESFY